MTTPSTDTQDTIPSNCFSLQGKVLKLTTAEEILPHILPLTTSQSYTQIAFSGNTIGVPAGTTLAHHLSLQPSLKIIEMSDMFTGRLKSEIPLILTALMGAFHGKPITHLNLSDNAFGPAGAEPLVPFLKNNNVLTTLHLNNNGLGIGGGKIIASALVDNNKLDTIIMGRNRMESEGSMVLIDALSGIQTLKVLRMPQNSIRPDGIKHIMEKMKRVQLETLDLQDNTFTESGCDALVGALDAWSTSLKVLNIGECLLGNNSIHT